MDTSFVAQFAPEFSLVNLPQRVLFCVLPSWGKLLLPFKGNGLMVLNIVLDYWTEMLSPACENNIVFFVPVV